MPFLTAIKDTWRGFRSLLTGLRITGREALQPSVTVQYPHDTVKMPERFRGHIKLVLDPETGLSRCTACNLCVRACPSECIHVEGEKKEGAKKKSVTTYELNFTTCSLCGSCIEACPSDAIEFSKDYNVVARDRRQFENMDLVAKLNQEAEAWAARQPPKPEETPPASPAEPKPPSPES
jgi:NADH-quinone oxidoreductase subunit I